MFLTLPRKLTGMFRVHFLRGLAALLLVVGLVWSLPAQATPLSLPAVRGVSPAAGGDALACPSGWLGGESTGRGTLGCRAFVDLSASLAPVWADKAFKTTNAIFWENPHKRVLPLAVAELPEPVMLVLMGLGLVVLAMLRRRAGR